VGRCEGCVGAWVGRGLLDRLVGIASRLICGFALRGLQRDGRCGGAFAAGDAGDTDTDAVTG
jgi:hypothetical protein